MPIFHVYGLTWVFILTKTHIFALELDLPIRINEMVARKYFITGAKIKNILGEQNPLQGTFHFLLGLQAIQP